MDKFLTTLVCSTVGYAIIYMYLLWPTSRTLYRLFPFYQKQEISIQAYIDYAAWRVLLCVLFYNFMSLAEEFSPKYEQAFQIIFWLWVGFLIDYLLFYNQPVTKMGRIPISYSLLMGIVLFFTVVISIAK